MCGPTVYDLSHIGHARVYIVFDVIAKYLRYAGYELFYLQNITNIEDKIIKRANERKVSPSKLAMDFEKEYLKDMGSLKVNSITKYARATDYIPEIISQIERLLKKGYAYKIKDGIYYNIKKFKKYGKLSKRTVLQAEDSVSRIDENRQKINRGDFCLWKFYKPGEPKWISSLGLGRPGWHIEDTAITEKHFGPQYDIHGGGQDLIIPHHEAEIALMETISGKSPMVNYWLHTEFLNIKKTKMAKSLGNFITIRNFLNSHGPRILRFFIVKTHYRSPINYDEKEVEQIKSQLGRIDEFTDKLNIIKGKTRKTKKGLTRELLQKTKKEFEGAMDDDFNTPKALASIFDLISKGNSLIAQNKLASPEAKSILEFLRKIDKVLNLIFWEKPKEKIPSKVLSLVKKREEYRKEKNWKSSDKVRLKLKKMGYWIEDTSEGTKIKAFDKTQP